MSNKVYKNSTPLMNLHGVPIYMNDMVDACLYGRLNLFLQGDTGSGKTLLAKEAMSYFGDRSISILGRNDMDIRELFQRFNLHKLSYKPKYDLEPLVNSETGEIEWYYPKIKKEGVFSYRKITQDQAKLVKTKLEQLAGTTEDVKELTSKINANLIVVDELPNCVSAVRAQLFNLFDGFIEINGRNYSLGDGYSVGIATGNIGQQFTESSNDLGRALKDRMHVIIDADYFFPRPRDTHDILNEDTNPRVEFTRESPSGFEDIIKKHNEVVSSNVPLEKLIIANYLLHGLDSFSKGSKRKMKDSWSNALENHESGSDIGLVSAISPRAAKSIIRLSQSLDYVARQKLLMDSQSSDKADNSDEIIEKGYLNSMLQAYKFVSAYSGVLNDSAVRSNYHGDNYAALDAVIASTKTQFSSQAKNIGAGLEMVDKGELNKKVLDLYRGRWEFLRDIFESLIEKNRPKEID